MKMLMLGLSALCFASPLVAQDTVPDDCLGLLAATLQNGRPVGNIDGCAPHLIGAYVDRLNAVPGEADLNRLAILAQYASYIRDPAILSAAWALIENPSAPAAARNLGLVLAINEHQRGLVPEGGISYHRLLTDTVSSGCYLTASPHAQYSVNNALPPDELAQTVRRARAVLRDAGAAETTRRLAACIVRQFGPEVEPDPDFTKVFVSYVCDRFYQLRNETDTELTLDWTIEGSDDVAGTTLAPHTEQRIFVYEPGRVLQLRYVHPVTRKSRIIATVPTTPRPCP